MGTVSQDRLGIASGFLAITRTLGQTTGVAVIGTIFAARAATHAGQTISANLDTASAAALVRGLHEAMIIVGVMMFLATLISAVGLWKRWEHKPTEDSQQTHRVAPQEPA
jgi:ABC-type phosphate transport system permease subunit